jgi:membrane-associated phospholipid phosphatase
MACNTLKMIFLRARPDTGVGPFVFFHWSALASDTRPYESFPSGDVAIVAGAAAVFFFKTRAPWRWLWLILPLCTAYSRVLLNRHWPADTLASLGLGLWVAFCLSGYAPDPRPASRGAETMRCS